MPTLVTIDDNELDQLIYRRLIERSGAVENLVDFLRAEDAVDYLRAGRPADAILLDIRMPGMDGFEFLEALDSDPGQMVDTVVVAMLTTSLDTHDQDRIGRHQIVRDQLSKPLNAADVWRVAALVAGLHAATDAN